MRALRAWLLPSLALLLGAPLAARAEEPPASHLDAGRFIVLEHDVAVATESFRYDQTADSIVISIDVERRARGADGSSKPFSKRAGLVVDASDFALRRYLSTQEFDGHKVSRGVQSGDTSLTVYVETDGIGDASGLVQPPGRLFVIDPGVFTLFDVLCRSLHGHVLGKRPVELLTLGAKAATAEAEIVPAGSDTVRWGGRRLITSRYLVGDAGARFTAWVSPEGHLLRLEHEGGDIVVQREEPAVVPPPAARRSRKKTR